MGERDKEEDKRARVRFVRKYLRSLKESLFGLVIRGSIHQVTVVNYYNWGRCFWEEVKTLCSMMFRKWKDRWKRVLGNRSGRSNQVEDFQSYGTIEFGVTRREEIGWVRLHYSSFGVKFLESTRPLRIYTSRSGSEVWVCTLIDELQTWIYGFFVDCERTSFERLRGMEVAPKKGL